MKKIPPERKSEQKWIEQLGDEDLNWNNIYTNRLQATNQIKSFFISLSQSSLAT